jgi:hypothetical protein
MLNTIENSQVFKKEFTMFSEKISRIQNETVKKELSSKLNELLKEVRQIDSQHRDIFDKKTISSTVPESRSKLMELRRHLDTRLKEFS